MNTKPLQFTLREWRIHFSKPAVWVALLAVAAVLTIVAPFDSDETMRALPRFGYWLFITVACYHWGFLCDTCTRSLQSPHKWLRPGISAVATAVGVVGLVVLWNALSLGFVPALSELPVFAATVGLIAFIISVTLAYVSTQAPSESPAKKQAPILERLPYEKRGPLVALSVEDHYVRVQTTKGEALILMRLSDAMRETGETRGTQIHRSHWAAFDKVTAARRDGDRAILTMTTGVELPVSRANLSKIKEAGLLPDRT